MKPSMVTEEDIKLVKEFLLLPLLLSALERDLAVINQSRIGIKQPYVSMIQGSMDRITHDIASIHKGFAKRGIRVYKQKREDHKISCSYMCRGYERKFEMLWGYAIAETEIRLAKYLVG